MLAYISSFFKVMKWENGQKAQSYINPCQDCIDLWEKGLIPVYNYETKAWKLCSYKGVVYSE